MTIEEKNIIWLDLFDNLSYNKKVKMLSLLKIGESIFSLFKTQSVTLKQILCATEYDKMSSCCDEKLVDNALTSYEKKNIKLVTILSNEYPKILKESVEPALCLYCKGNIQLLNTIGCAVVGTRNPSEYGIVITKQFTKELVKCGVTIVSGMANGVDTIAHECAVRENGATIAVLAGGFDHIYPASNQYLFKMLCENNLVVTEHRPSVRPNGYLFPLRNRIIAGLSRAVLITEAGAKSGALHTKNYAVESGREVFAIPGRINSPQSEGTNNIIKQCQTCLCSDPKQILDYLGVIDKKFDNKPVYQLDIQEQTILNYILADKKSYQEIADFTQIPPRELNTILINMQMKGYIEKLMGNSYISLIKS